MMIREVVLTGSEINCVYVDSFILKHSIDILILRLRLLRVVSRVSSILHLNVPPGEIAGKGNSDIRKCIWH